MQIGKAARSNGSHIKSRLKMEPHGVFKEVTKQCTNKDHYQSVRAPMARGGRAPDGRALSPSSAIPGARLMPAMRLRHTRRRRNPSRCPAPVCGLMQVAGPPPVGVTLAQPRDLPPTSSSTRQKIIAAVIMCAEGYGVGFDTLSFFGWFGSTSLGALCTLHPLPRPCLHARGGVTLADVTAGCCSHLP